MFSAKARWGIAFITSFASISMSAPAASAQEGAFDVFTGNGFLQNCGETLSDENTFRLGICHGWLSGFMDRESLASDPEIRKICIPPGVTNGQRMDVVLKYLRDNPGQRHLPISILAYIALMESFPC